MTRVAATWSLLTIFLLPSIAAAQAPLVAVATVPQTQEDDYTRYELLAPGTGQFRILYEVTATKASAPYFFNVIRKGSVATDERVSDAATGQPLQWAVVTGAQARAEGHPTADLTAEWIKVTLARPVPVGGEARVVIDKTYKDDKSYYRDGDAIVFDRSLGIRRNAVVLPAGYRLVRCNVPSQVLSTPDGRVMITFQNPGPGAAPLRITAVPGLPAFTPAWPTSAGGSSPRSVASHADRLVDRAHQDREATFRLQAPETHTFELEHDVTESRVGVGHYVELPASGAVATAPVVHNLDTGEALTVQTMTGKELAARRFDVGLRVPDDALVHVGAFPPIAAGRSVRLRVLATLTDPSVYTLDGDELVWDMAFDRPRNTVLLPAGWTVVASAMPAVIETAADGRQRLIYENARPDVLQVLIRARRVR